MCKKLIYLVSFVCMLGLVSAAMAEDLEPPYWAGCEYSAVTFWEFDRDPVLGEVLLLFEPGEEGPTDWFYNPELNDYEFSVWPSYGEVIWDEEGQCLYIPEEDETGFYMSTCNGSGPYITLYAQITYSGSEEENWPMLEGWSEASREGEYLVGIEGDELDYWGEPTEIEEGVFHAVFYHTFPWEEWGMDDVPPYVNLLIWLYEAEIYEVILDVVIHEDEEPPEGPGRAVKVVKVSNEQPANGEEHVDPNDPNIVCFQPPANALCMDPCADPCLCGPFTYDVYFSSDPCELVWIPPTIGPTNANDVMCVDPCAGDLNPGTEYFWSVDITDANCCPEEPCGDPCFYEGPIFSFITWGFATDPVPPDGEGDVDTGTIELKWTGDGFVGGAGTGYNVYFPEDTPVGYQDCGTADANKYTPDVTLELGTEYCWRVDEVNTVTIPGHVWCFTTSLCSTWETFEEYINDEAIYTVWVDWFINGTGSMIYLGKEIDNEPVYGGVQSMEYYYDNTADPFYSESTRTFDPTVDWSTESDIAPGARALRIWFHDMDEEGAGAEQMYVKLYDGTTEGRVDFDPDTSVTEEDWTWIEATDEDVLWIGWSIDLSDFGVELSTIESMTIGFDTEATDGTVFFDTFQLCGTRCIPAQAPWSWNDDCETEWFELEEIIFENWLAMDDWVHILAPNDANLIVEYTFDNNDLTDTAGVGPYHGIGVNEPNIHDGLMTLDGNDWVIVPIDPCLFQGDKSWTVEIDIVADNNVGVIFGVAREPYGLNAEGWPEYYYDPCICNDPCEPDANYCDEGLPPYPYEGEEEATHGLAIFQEEERIVADRSWIAETAVWDLFPDGEEHQVVLVYDAEEESCLIYVDETAGEPMWANPNVPDPCEDTVTIGHTENWCYPGADMDIFNFIGDIDNFKIYNYALSYGEVLGKLYPEDVCTDYELLLDTPANVDDQTVNYDGRARQIINLRDFALFAEHWLEVVLWPPEE